jgi:hypothetical protein
MSRHRYRYKLSTDTRTVTVPLRKLCDVQRLLCKDFPQACNFLLECCSVLSST